MQMKKRLMVLSLSLITLAWPCFGQAQQPPPKPAPAPAPYPPFWHEAQAPAPAPAAAIESSPDSYPTQCPAEGQKISVAVYPIKPAGSDPALASAMTALISSQLAHSPKLKVIEEAMLKTVMERQGMNASDACDDTSCQVEIGKLVKAQKLIAGDLSKLGQKYVFSLKLTDIQTGALEFTADVKCSCPEDQLDTLVEAAAAQVRNHFCENLAATKIYQGQPLASDSPAPTTASSSTFSPVNPQPPSNPLIPGPSSPAKALLFVYRESSIYEEGGKIKVILDGQEIYRIRDSECIRKEIEPGKHIIQYKIPLTTGQQGFPFWAVGGANNYALLSFNNERGLIWNFVSESDALKWAPTCQEVSVEPAKTRK